MGATDIVLQLIDDITSDLDIPTNKFVQLASLDFSNTFDMLQPKMILDEISKHGISENVLTLGSIFGLVENNVLEQIIICLAIWTSMWVLPRGQS